VRRVRDEQDAVVLALGARENSGQVLRRPVEPRERSEAAQAMLEAIRDGGCWRAPIEPDDRDRHRRRRAVGGRAHGGELLSERAREREREAGRVGEQRLEAVAPHLEQLALAGRARGRRALPAMQQCQLAEHGATLELPDHDRRRFVTHHLQSARAHDVG
jgi:hypothetical protein